MKRPKSRGAQFQYKIVHCSHYRIMVGPPISGHITAIRSSELGAQLILPHQKTKKRRNHHTCKHVLMPCHVAAWQWSVSWATLKKGGFQHSMRRRWKKEGLPSSCGQLFNTRLRLSETRKKANCSTLRKWIPRLKVSIQKSGRCKVSRNGAPSSESIAPCRSHHGNHTRLEWINKVIRRELNPMHT